MDKPFNRAIKLCGTPERIGSMGVSTLMREIGGNALFVTGAGAPTNSLAGFAKGCKYLRTDGGANTTWYVNEGTEQI